MHHKKIKQPDILGDINLNNNNKNFKGTIYGGTYIELEKQRIHPSSKLL